MCLGIRMKHILIVLTAFLIGRSTVTGQTSAVVPQDKDRLLKGDPMGLEQVAERNGYPSVEKILSMKDRLALTKDQVKKLQEIAVNLPVSATVKGQEIIDAEEELNGLFASENLKEKILRQKLERIGRLRAELRFAHLQPYLKARQILTPNQWALIKEAGTGEGK